MEGEHHDTVLCMGEKHSVLDSPLNKPGRFVANRQGLLQVSRQEICLKFVVAPLQQGSEGGAA